MYYYIDCNKKRMNCYTCLSLHVQKCNCSKKMSITTIEDMELQLDCCKLILENLYNLDLKLFLRQLKVITNENRKLL